MTEKKTTKLRKFTLILVESKPEDPLGGRRHRPRGFGCIEQAARFWVFFVYRRSLAAAAASDISGVLRRIYMYIALLLLLPRS